MNRRILFILVVLIPVIAFPSILFAQNATMNPFTEWLQSLDNDSRYDELATRVAVLESRVSLVEGGVVTATPVAATSTPRPTATRITTANRELEKNILLMAVSDYQSQGEVFSYLLEDHQKTVLGDYRYLLLNTADHCVEHHTELYYWVDNQADRLDKGGVSDLKNVHMRSYLLKMLSLGITSAGNPADVACQRVLKEMADSMIYPDSD